MKRVLSLFLLLLVPISADAQAPQVERIDVFEYGIYTGTVTRKEAAPNSASGLDDFVTNVQHAVRIIPAQQGVQFGFRYTVVGAPASTVVPLHKVTIFPPPGLRNPATPQLRVQSERDLTAAIGVPSWTSYILTNDWEVASGTWTMQIWYQGNKLAEQSFTVVKE